ncbi:hypothetical protein KEM48_014363 [Puccinia striiformis f. sp. tritici PST-130]|nr:hypothetical protein KEM48_014363 [Puccinia striiformis f. sp. tritici PST-130]
MAVVLVKGVSLTNGHKEVRSPLKASASGSTPGKNGRNFYQFGKKPKTPTTPMASGSGTKVAESPLKGKGKIEEPLRAIRRTIHPTKMKKMGSSRLRESVVEDVQENCRRAFEETQRGLN